MNILAADMLTDCIIAAFSLCYEPNFSLVFTSYEPDKIKKKE